MHLFKFFRYFLYLATNWNVKIAWHILQEEIRGEKKYGIRSTGADELKSIERKGIDISHATIYMPASYDVLETVFQKFNPASFNHLVDIGCGKGRSLCVAATMGAKKITGVDFSKDFCADAKKNLSAVQQKNPNFEYRIFNNDAFYFEIDKSVDCIFLFNPFDEIIMSGVLENIEISMGNNPRKMTVIYVNPLQKHLFLQYNFKQIYHFQKLHYLEVSVFEKG